MFIFLFFVYLSFSVARGDFDYDAYCNECIVDKNCICRPFVKGIWCDGENSVDQFPILIKNSTFCTTTEINVDFEIFITNYQFEKIPANSFPFTSTKIIDFKISSNSKLRSIDSEAFAKLNASVETLDFSENFFQKFPGDSLEFVSFANTMMINLKFESNQIEDLEELPRILKLAGPRFYILNFYNNTIKNIPSNTFSNVEIFEVDLR